MTFQTNELYHRPYRVNTLIIVLERHATHIVVDYKRERYCAKPFFINGVEHITLPFGTFDAASLGCRDF